MRPSFHEIADVFGKYDFHIERMHWNQNIDGLPFRSAWLPNQGIFGLSGSAENISAEWKKEWCNTWDPEGSKPLLAFPFLGGISHLYHKRFKAFLLCLIKARTTQNGRLDVTKYRVGFRLPLLPLSVNTSITSNKEISQCTNVPKTCGQCNRTSRLLFQMYWSVKALSWRWKKLRGLLKIFFKTLHSVSFCEYRTRMHYSGKNEKLECILNL